MAKVECEVCRTLEYPRLRYASRRLLHQHLFARDLDYITRWFVHIIASDPELDHMLTRIDLWPEECPYVDNGYSHHDGWRT